MRLRNRAFSALVTVGLVVAGVATLTSLPASAEPGAVVISQVYGGGGNAGAPLTNDYVELFNRSTGTLSLDGWSVQYASATGTGNFAANPVAALSGSIPPGGYHLVQLAGGASGSPPPAADSTGAANLSGGAGKVALVRSATGLACNGGSAACSAEQLALVADLVGYGTANFFEGSGAAPALSVTTAGLRKENGCLDTDQNATDLESGAPAPRNSASPAAPCGPDSSPTPTPTVTPTPTPTVTPEPCDVAPTHEVAQVQGSGASTPIPGQTVRVEGVVTGDFQETTQLSGFYLQDPTPDADPATSDGLFVFARASIKDVNVGDRVLVTGRAAEFNGLTQVSSVTAVDVCGTGTVAPRPVSLPLAEGASFEPLEGVLLRFPEPLVATEHFNLGRFGEVTVSSEGRLFHPTDRAGGSQALNNRRSLLVDDGSNVQNPAQVPYTSPRTVRLGDAAVGIEGVLSYGFNLYRLQPTKPITFLRTNPRIPVPFPVIGNVKVASFNTLNWFTTDNPPGRGANNPAERTRQLDKLVSAIKTINADVVGLMEVENNGQTALDALVGALNAQMGAGTYAALAHPFPGTDVIQVGVVYKPGKVRPVGAAESSEDPVFSRPPLIQKFERTGGSEPFTMIVNHFKSKRCDGATGPEADQGDGQACWNPTRIRQSQAVLDLIATRNLVNPLVIGDLNSYGEEDPIDTLEAAGLVSATKRFVPAPLRYTYTFEAQSGELDHAMVGGTLRNRLTSAAIWHINADEARILDYNTEFNPPSLYAPDAYRSSDHDPVVLGLTLLRR
ncbi:ExeM/NucH family extracellular endonuclease [Rhizohabitans arisaemae]|uniref:ExeM/NucH family extracellular endonuclease n=1 Tax=Rhizohabitans arisaemae TaxID=2720610 RepID=UPI0024B10622|nr:ExeM/NucH family extracellular endonuclease [Rhizohabitans arisaemae]